MRKNLIIAVTDQGLVSVATFATGILVARILGVETFGVYVLASGSFLFLASLQQALVLTPMSVYGAANKKDTRQYIYSTHKLQLLIAIIITCLLLIVSQLGAIKNISPQAQEAFIWLSPVAFFQLSYDFWRQLLLSRQQLPLLLAVDTFSKTILITSLIILAVIFSETATLKHVYFILVLSSVIGTSFAWYKARHYMASGKASAYWKKNIEFGKWAVSNLLILMGNGQIPYYSAAFIIGTTATGVLGAAVQLLGVFQIFLNGIVNYYLPIAVHAYNDGGITELKKQVRHAMLLMSSLVSIVTIPTILYTDTIVEIIYGKDFLDQGIETFRILLAVAFVLGIQRALDIMVRVLEKMKVRSHISLIEMLFLITATYPAAQFAGLTGIAAIAVGGRILSTIILFFVLWVNFDKQTNK